MSSSLIEPEEAETRETHDEDGEHHHRQQQPQDQKERVGFKFEVNMENTVKLDFTSEVSMEALLLDSIAAEQGRDVNGVNCSPVEEEQQQQQPEHDEESGCRDEIRNSSTDLEVAAGAPESYSTPGKRGIEEIDLNHAPAPKERVSKKRKDANGNCAQLEKGRRQTPQQLQDGGKKKKKEYFFQFGNYHRYYGYRLGKTVNEDPRLKWFRREWFEGKKCLDIGCNEGFVTISIAQKYKCRSILGVDIDNFLIKKAISNLKEAAGVQGLNDIPLEEGELEQNMVPRTWEKNLETCNDTVGNGSASEIDDEWPSSGSESLLQRVKFREEQFIKDFPDGDYKKDGMFDTVLCLSVTKWVHLNWGDNGLIRLFAKIYHILRQGGIFILEPQPWKSYQKKYHISEVTRRCFQYIELTPAHFKEVLLDKIGFRSVEELTLAVPNSSLGFDRSLFLYLK